MKKLLFLMAFATSVCNAASSDRGALQPLPLGHIVARGWLGEQLARSRDGMGGHLDELEPTMIATPYVTRETEKSWGKNGPGWGSEISGNYWAGLIGLAWSLDDAGLKAKATKWAEVVLKNAEPDGYLGVYKPTDDRQEDYVAFGGSCGYRALLDFAEAANRPDVFDAVYRCMLWFCRNWAGDRKTRYCGVYLTGPMLTCYRKTGDRRLLDFCRDYQRFLEEKDLFSLSVRAFGSDDFDYNASHAVAYCMQLAMPPLFYCATGERPYLDAGLKGMAKLHRHAFHATGCPAGQDEYLSPPHVNVDTEYCTFAALVEAYSALAAASGDTRWGDRMEETFFNAAQGARRKDERAIQYYSSPNQIYVGPRAGHNQQNSNLFAPCHPVACCPVLSVKILSLFTRSLAMTDARGNLTVVGYAPCMIRHRGCEITCETLYPFDGKVVFTVRTKQPARFDFRAKKPDWCECVRVAVNGVADAATDRLWQDGDRLTVDLALTPRLARHRDGAGLEPLVVRRGALVFALPIAEQWSALGNGVKGVSNGHAQTPLPKGWNWWGVMPAVSFDGLPQYEGIAYRRDRITWNIALDERTAAFETVATGATGYVWEKPPVKLRVTGYKAPYAYAPYPSKTQPTYSPLLTVTRPESVELVPFGCTALRITYFPRCDAAKLRPDLDFRPDGRPR